jgi:hypothetical protein
MFLDAECYEWAFLLALVIKNHGIINQIIHAFKTSNSLIHFSSNFYKGLNELKEWGKTEWYVISFY